MGGMAPAERRFNPAPATALRISDKARIVLVGDWGSGIPSARRVGEQIRCILEEGKAKGIEQHVIHLGDVYYSGFAWEYEKRFLAHWPVKVDEADKIASWCLAGNHDIYSGGAGYYDFLLRDPRFKRHEGSSFFRIYNRNWDILGLDTSYDSDILGYQPEWIESVLAESTRSVMLLSHRYPFSRLENDVIRDAERFSWLVDGRICAWFWGHEHKCILYDPSRFLKYGRCVGNGGMPTRSLSRDLDDLQDRFPSKSFLGEDVPAGRLPFRNGDVDESGLGFAVLDFQSPEMRVRYISDGGREFVQEIISPANLQENATSSSQVLHTAEIGSDISTGPAWLEGADASAPKQPSATALPQEEQGQRQHLTPLYPSVDPEPEHVVQGRSFRVAVALQSTPSFATPGEVQLPSGEEHTLDVHLLLGENSKWDTLVWSRAHGTTKKAEFDLSAPLIKRREDGGLPDQQVLTLAANFYLNGRWCGEGLRNIEVLRNDAVLPSAAIEPPEAAKWQKLLNIEPGAEPPDLLVRIKNVAGDLYEWNFLSPHLDLRPRPGDLPVRKELKNGPHRFVRVNFDRISGKTLDAETIPVIEARCREIYKSTPDAFKDAYWKLYFAEANAVAQPLVPGTIGKLPRLKSIQFISDEPYVPWELMLVRDDQRGRGVREEILSIRHAVGRWIAEASGRLQQNIEVREMAVFASDYKNISEVEPKLDWAVKEQELLVKDYGARPKALKFDTVTKFLREGSAQAVHFSCHGEMNVEQPTESALKLEDFPKFVTAYVTQDAVREGEGSQHPLVFLNACQLAGAGSQLGLVTGWPQSFLEAGASACIAPLWSVIDETAEEAAAMFYRLVFKERRALGEALQEIRKGWRDRRSLTFLSYVLYGDPSAHVVWQPVSDAREHAAKD